MSPVAQTPPPRKDDSGSHRAPSLGLHGRRKGKKLRAKHTELIRTVLPAVRFDPSETVGSPASLFDESPSTLWLEIGFGGGEHLTAEASAHPKFGYIGCEPFLNGVAKALALIEAGDLHNVRIYDGDARAVIEALPSEALDGVYLLYPDPWPKRKHHKRRFLSDDMLMQLARVMRPGAELRFATDVDDNAGWTLARILRSLNFVWAPTGPQDWQQPWREWSGTRYEAKALKDARRPAYFTFRRT